MLLMPLNVMAGPLIALNTAHKQPLTDRDNDNANSATVCIQDKNGKHYNTLCSADYTVPEIRNMLRHLAQAELYPARYAGATAKTMLLRCYGNTTLHLYQYTS